MRSRIPLVFLLTGALALGPVALFTETASAKSAYESPYGYNPTWNAALRLVVVDMSLKVTEKDLGSGYILFEYKSSESGAKVSPGSIELIKPSDPNGTVHVVAQLPAMPRYHEQVLLDSLARKLRDEYGEPIVVKRKAPVEDAGSGDDAADPN